MGNLKDGTEKFKPFTLAGQTWLAHMSASPIRFYDEDEVLRMSKVTAMWAAMMYGFLLVLELWFDHLTTWWLLGDALVFGLGAWLLNVWFTTTTHSSTSVRGITVYNAMCDTVSPYRVCASYPARYHAGDKIQFRNYRYSGDDDVRVSGLVILKIQLYNHLVSRGRDISNVWPISTLEELMSDAHNPYDVWLVMCKENSIDLKEKQNESKTKE